MNVEVSEDLLHHWMQVFDAARKHVDARLLLREGESRESASDAGRSWSPLYERVTAARVSERFAKATAMDIIDLLLRELELTSYELENLVKSAVSPEEHRRGRDFDPGSVLSDVTDLFRFKADARGIDFREDIARTTRIRGDPRMLRRALVNIIDNAVKYSYEAVAGMRRHIDVNLWRHSADGNVAILVKSLGVGVEAGELEAVFERGTRGRFAVDRNRRGTGIGLYEARRLISEMGGVIWLESARQPGDVWITSTTIHLGGS